MSKYVMHEDLILASSVLYRLINDFLVYWKTHPDIKGSPTIYPIQYIRELFMSRMCMKVAKSRLILDIQDI